MKIPKIPRPRLLDSLRASTFSLAQRIMKSLGRFLAFCGRQSREVTIALILAVVFAFIAALWVKNHEEQSQAHAIQAIQNAEARIVTYDKDNKPQPLGVGIFVSSDGRLVTNYHVIKTARVVAKLRTGAFYEYKALVNYDPHHDLSVLQFEGDGIPYVNLGDSDKIDTGKRVYAVLGVDSGVLPTFVSGRRRWGPNVHELIEFVASSVTPSGGGLFDEKGTIVGLVSTKLLISEASKEVSRLLAFSINPLKPLILGRETASAEKDPDFYYSRGILAENKGNHDEATADFKKATQLDPRYAEAYMELGGMAYDEGRFDDQLSNYQKAAEYAPNNTDILYYLATAYEDKSLYNEAVDVYKRVLRINPKHKDSLYQLGILYIIQGNRHEAQQLAIRLGDLDPGLSGELMMLLRRMR